MLHVRGVAVLLCSVVFAVATVAVGIASAPVLSVFMLVLMFCLVYSFTVLLFSSCVIVFTLLLFSCCVAELLVSLLSFCYLLVWPRCV